MTALCCGLKRKKGNPIGPPFNNLQEIETNTVFSDRVCNIDEDENGGLPFLFKKKRQNRLNNCNSAH